MNDWIQAGYVVINFFLFRHVVQDSIELCKKIAAIRSGQQQMQYTKFSLNQIDEIENLKTCLESFLAVPSVQKPAANSSDAAVRDFKIIIGSAQQKTKQTVAAKIPKTNDDDEHTQKKRKITASSGKAVAATTSERRTTKLAAMVSSALKRKLQSTPSLTNEAGCEIEDRKPIKMMKESSRAPANMEASTSVHSTIRRQVKFESFQEFDGNLPQFKVVEHVGYLARKGTVMYKCFVDRCMQVFDGNVEKAFRHHLRTSHSNVIWSGSCVECDSIIQNEKYPLEDEMHHLQVAHFMPEQQAERLKLRPWIKRPQKKVDDCAAQMLQKKCLVAVFKCMEVNCKFFTSLVEKFAEHLKSHKQVEGCREQDCCAYCPFKGKDDTSLISHYESAHQHDSFQCSLCFYRCASASGVQKHGEIYHPKQSQVVIECLPSTCLNPNDVARSLMSSSNLDQCVLPMKCCSCDKSFYVLEGFKRHIKSKHQNDYKDVKLECVGCSQLRSTKKLICHFQDCYQIALYQCLYCRYGANFFQTFAAHLLNEHQSKLPFFCSRFGWDNVRIVNQLNITKITISF